jgi:hypothetical protein
MPRIAKQLSRQRQQTQVLFGRFSPDELRTHAPQIPPENIPWRYIACAGYNIDENGVKHFHHQEMLPCDCPPGPHEWAVTSRADEIALLGGAGSGKTEDTFGFILKGNPAPRNSRADVSYCNHPHYRFLVLRRNSVDLTDWFDRFSAIARRLGAECPKNPMTVRFPSGATGFFGHLEDEQSYMKYMGHEYVRIVVEEASHIPSELLWIRLKQRNRTRYMNEMQCQMMLTANPIGPGVRWINARFRFRPDGSPIKSCEKYRCPLTGNTRVWIYSTAWDNPYWLADQDQSYIRNLEALKQFNEIEYRRMALGDFDCIEGSFFPMFRKERRASEPENALHVIPARPLAPWWPRAIGMDWGFSHHTGVVWGAWSPDKQLMLYRETKFKGLDTVQAGAEVARLSMIDLDGLPSRHMNLFLSHDCFHKDGRESEADQIARGINTVLGAGAAFVFSPTDDEEKLDPKLAWEAVKRRQLQHGRSTVITLIPAGGGTKRRHGFSLMREYMRWQPLVMAAEFNEEYAKHLVLTEGALAYHEYRDSFRKAAEEKLPVLQIFNTLPQLISCIEAIQEKPGNTEEADKQDGDDLVDAAVHLIKGFPFGHEEAPRDVQIKAKMDAIAPGWENSNLDLVRRYHEAKLGETEPQPFTLPRVAGPTRRRYAN